MRISSNKIENSYCFTKSTLNCLKYLGNLFKSPRQRIYNPFSPSNKFITYPVLTLAIFLFFFTKKSLYPMKVRKSLYPMKVPKILGYPTKVPKTLGYPTKVRKTLEYPMKVSKPLKPYNRKVHPKT